MSKIDNVIGEIHHIENMTRRDIWINRIHPLSKVIVTITYIALIMSYEKYDILGMFPMLIYPVFMLPASELSLKKLLKRFRIIIFAVVLLGCFNPIFDRKILYEIGSVAISGGMISMCTLIMKALLAVMASFILLETTSIDEFCYALRIIRIPKVIVSVIMLIYRYIILMLDEVGRVSQAYMLRAPGQKGINYKAWGPFLGQMILRSIDRAQVVYESMMLRGFNGEYYLKKKKNSLAGVIFLIVWTGIFIFVRLCF